MKLDYERTDLKGRPDYGWLFILVATLLLVGAWIVQPRFSSSAGGAKLAAARQDIATLKGDVESFRADTGRDPSGSERLDALVEAPPGISHWNGPYVEKIPTDPWAHPYVYRRQAASRNPYDLFSCGPDGQADTGDDIH